MCAQGMNWDTLYDLQAIKSKTFPELATQAMIWSLQFPTIGDSSIMTNQCHLQELEAPYVETLKRMNAPIWTLMHQ